MVRAAVTDATDTGGSAAGAPAAPRGARAGLAATVAAALGEVAPTVVWRNAIAAFACVLTVASLTGGEIQWFAWLQIGLIAGAVVGVVTATPAHAALVAAGSTAAGLLLGPPDAFRPGMEVGVRIGQGAFAVVVATATALAVVALVSRNHKAAWYICLAAIALIVVDLWVTPLDINGEQTFDPATQSYVPSFNERLGATEVPAAVDNDHVFFLRVSRAVADGQPYYETFRREFVTWSGGKAPSAATNIRFPLIFYVWSLLPGRSVVVGFLALATVALAAAVHTGIAYVKPPVVVPACAALAAYFVYFTIGFVVISAEAWAACFALLAAAALVHSYRVPSWRTWVVVSVILGVLAALVRETLVFVPLAAIVAAAVHPREQRRFRLVATLGGAAAAAVALGTHYYVAGSVVDPASPYSQFMRGSLANVHAALVYATDELGYGGWFALTLSLVGIAGVVALPDKRTKAFFLVAGILPLVSFLFLGNTAVDVYSRQPINYWGAGVVPLLYACIPFIFLFLPGAARGLARDQQHDE